MYGNQFGGVNPQYYNPQLEQRINQLQNYQYPQQPQYNPQPQQMQVPQPQTPQKIIIPIASIDEIRAYATPMDGGRLYFEELASGKIYIKYLSLNGSSVIDVFEKTTSPTNTQDSTVINTEDFVSKTEFEELRNKVSQYESIFNELMGGNKVNE